MKTQLNAALLFALFCAANPLTSQSAQPLVQAHAHNDYLHPHPLFDALEHGFCSVEADIHLVNGQLLVAHDLAKTKPERTLQALYLDPLRQLVKKNGGRVYPHGPEFTLLIDLKGNWKILYPPLRAALTNYGDMLTTFQGSTKQTKAVLVIITGNRDRTMFGGETVRYAGFDGELTDLEQAPDASFAPWISTKWSDHFTWRGTGVMPEAELKQLGNIVSKAHAQKRRVRFWDAPDNSAGWQTMLAAGVDLINTDDLSGVEKLLLKRQGR